ncbi:PstS family phosphate ABC transporter substrate-binding protein [Nitrospira sp. T9]|uniref:PstS family phosphate ABC transporter substrate-binding protein n=1 Tax=unclassified Nitrospira TaxID=2652172 RepID=UPI003F9C3ECC
MKRMSWVIFFVGTMILLLQELAGAESKFKPLSQILANAKFSITRPSGLSPTFPTRTGRAGIESCLHYTPAPLLSPEKLFVLGENETLSLAEDIEHFFSNVQKLLTVKARSIETTQTPPWWQISQHSSIAIMSEPMNDHERLGFMDYWGYEPTQLKIAADPVVLIVHLSNPLIQRGISQKEIDAIFSQTPSREIPPMKTWSDLDLKGDWRSRSIILHGYDASVSLHDFFKFQALQGKDFHNRVHRHPSSGQVVFAVGKEKGALGFTKLSSVTPQVGIVPLRESSKQLPIDKNSRLNTAYAFTQYLYGYLNLNPQTHPDEAAIELFKFLYSQQGQAFLKNRGYVSLPITMISQEWNQLKKGSDKNFPDFTKMCSTPFSGRGFFFSSLLVENTNPLLS